MTQPILLDGAHGEGGGALLRTALAMSALTQQPMRVENVRGATRHPGLDPEDLTIVRALAESCAAETVGAEPGSKTLSFLPTRHPKGLGGALATVRNESNRGPNALVVLNTLLPVLTRSGVYCSLTAEGETFGGNALSFDAFQGVTLEAMKRTGLYAYTDLRRAGFGRESRGEVTLDVEPSALTGLQWTERGAFKGVQAVVTTANLPQAVADRAAAHLRLLARNANVPIEVEKATVEAATPGAFVTAWARYDRGLGGGAAAGGRGIKAEGLAEAAFHETIDFMESDATVDPYLADQILIPCVIAETPSAFKVSRLTQRFLTAVWVVKQFTPIHLTVRGSENHAGTVTIQK